MQPKRNHCLLRYCRRFPSQRARTSPLAWAMGTVLLQEFSYVWIVHRKSLERRQSIPGWRKI
jgi:hypothetical protein